MKNEIKEQAIIFRKTTNRPLSNFQIRVNDAAVDIALSQPNLMRKGNRGILLEKARQKVADSGYDFKKGASRSKKYGIVTAPKYSKMNQSVKEQRIKELEEDIADYSNSLEFKNKRLQQAELCKDYKLCDRLSEEIVECKGKLREVQNELKLLQKKSNKAKKRLEKFRKVNETASNMPVRSSTPVSPSASFRDSSPLPSSSHHDVVSEDDNGNVRQCSSDADLCSGDTQQTNSHFQ